MTIAELNNMPIEDLMKDFDTYLSTLYSEDTERTENVEKWIKEYNMEHDIFEREDKIVGENKDVVEVAKLGVPFQKKIVRTTAAFLFGSPVKMTQVDDDERKGELFKAFLKAYKSAKLDYQNNKVARRLFVETKVAELFYIRATKKDPGSLPPSENGEELPTDDPKVEKKIKSMILCKSNGDDIYPIWDDYGDMSGFLRLYAKEIVDETGEKKEVQVVEIYTATFNYYCTKSDEWAIRKYQNIFGKIPVIYYEQSKSEWDDVQSLIDRVETMLSKNADTNDYFGAPAIVSKGQLKTAPEKNEVGKFFEILPVTDEGRTTFGDLSYLTWDMAPEAIKMEYEMLKDLIYSQTSTPDLSFNNVKGTSNLSGIALKFMFLDTMLKSLEKQEIFGEALERRNNLLFTMLEMLDVSGNKGMKDLDVEIEFTSILPENMQEIVDVLVNATAGASIMTRETAVKLNPMVDNPEQEVENLEAEDQKNQENNPLIPESYGSET